MPNFFKVGRRSSQKRCYGVLSNTGEFVLKEVFQRCIAHHNERVKKLVDALFGTNITKKAFNCQQNFNSKNIFLNAIFFSNMFY